MEFHPPSWDALVRGACPQARQPEDRESGTTRRGWQQEASSRVEGEFRNEVFTRIPDQTQAMIRSQAGPGAGTALAVTPSNRESTIPSHLFQVILLRRLRFALLLSVRSCRCGRPLDSCGHHRRACLAEGGLHLESIIARICREEGGCVRTKFIARDMDVPAPYAQDGRRLEVVVDGLPVRVGVQVAMDTTLVCALHRDGVPRRRAAKRDAVALMAARKEKEATYPELFGPWRRTHLVVVEVGGSWSEETSELRLMRRRAEQAWRMGVRCGPCSRIFVAGLTTFHGGNGRTPAVREVDGDHRYAGLAPG